MLAMKSLLNFFNRAYVAKFFFTIMLVSILFIADGFLLLYFAAEYGMYVVLAVAAGTGLVGVIFLINSANTVLERLERRISDGVYPKREYAALAGLIVSGLLLLTPGFFTDALGILVYLPPLRQLMGRLVTRKLDGELRQAYEYLKLRDE